MRIIRFVVSLLFLSVAIPVRAAELYSSNVGSWMIGAYTNDQTGQFSHCAISAIYNSGIAVVFAVDQHYNWSMALTNANWNVVPGQTYEVQILIDQIPMTISKGTAISRTIVSVPLPDSTYLFSKMRTGRMLTLNSTGGLFNFRLDGSSVALAATIECVATARTIAQNPGKQINPQPTATTSPASGETRAEAIATLANTLSAAGVQNYSILSPQETKQKYPDKDVVWIAPGIAGWLNVVAQDDRSKTIEDIASLIIAFRSTECRGKFASTRLDGTAKFARILTACSDENGDSELYQIVSLREGGGYYALGFFALPNKGIDSQTPENVTATLAKVIVKQ